MSSRLINLPQETQTHVYSYLRHADLVNVMLTCKLLQKIVHPLIWTHIELHDTTWHEHDCYNNNHSRKYIEPFSETLQSFTGLSALHWMKHSFLQNRGNHLLVALSIAQPHTVRAVRSVCMEFAVYNDENHKLQNMWNLFGRLENLHVLDLTVNWPYAGAEDWDLWNRIFRDSDTPPPLTKLRELRLQAYVPRAFARWLLLNATQLSTLQLCILDRPISGSIANIRTNPPPRSGRSPEDSDDSEDSEDAEDDTEASGSDYEEEGIAPRALSILDHADTLENLKGLSTLLLSRPAESGEDSPVREAYCSVRCDLSILHEWTRLIRATRSTLKHLVIDQRPVCEEIEMDGTGSDEYMEMYPYGPGFVRFKKIVLPVLLEDAAWPELESMTFYGFDVPEPLKTQVHPRVPRPLLGTHVKSKKSFLPRVQERFEPMNVRVASHLGKRLTFTEETGVVSLGDGYGGGWVTEVEEE